MIRLNKIIINCDIDFQGKEKIEHFRKLLSKLLDEADIIFNYDDLTTKENKNDKKSNNELQH